MIRAACALLRAAPENRYQVSLGLGTFFYKIELLLRSRGCVSFAALKAELEVSPATLKRDLQYLRDRLSAPIVYDPADNGYRFSAATAGKAAGAPRHELPGLCSTRPRFMRC